MKVVQIFLPLIMYILIGLTSACLSRGNKDNDTMDSTNLPVFETIDEDIQNTYPKGIEVYNSLDDRFIGMLSFVQKGLPTSLIDPNEIAIQYGVIQNNQYLLIYSNKIGLNSSLNSHWSFRMIGSMPDPGFLSLVTVNNKDLIIQDTDTNELGYLKISELESRKNQLYLDQGSLKLFMLFEYEDIKYHLCYDISGANGSKNFTDNVYNNPSGSTNDGYDKYMDNNTSISYRTDAKLIFEGDECLMDAFNSTDIPPSNIDLQLIFKNKETGDTISSDELDSFIQK